jgi:hypothetical protein
MVSEFGPVNESARGKLQRMKWNQEINVGFASGLDIAEAIMKLELVRVVMVLES